ncbi:MAG: lactonase family protein [Candidatus Saccharimonadales bacterium]
MQRNRLVKMVALGAIAVVAAVLAAPSVSVIAAPARADSTGAAVGAVYVASNAYSANSILTFLRYADGSLVPGSQVPTGGRGSGPGLLLPDDPLASQNSLIVDRQKRFLFAVNAGSDDVSVLAINGSSLTVIDRQPSRGAYPVSLALFHHTLYVLNAIGNSVTGFSVGSDGKLTYRQTCALPNLPPGDGNLTGDSMHSTQPFVTQTAGEVGFSHNGANLVVVSKEGPRRANFPFGNTSGSGRIFVYQTDPATYALNCSNAPTITSLPQNAPINGNTIQGKFPFDFAWSTQGHLLLTEVFGTGTDPQVQGSAVQSFTLASDGSLTPDGNPVGSGQLVVCWIVQNDDRVYTANFLNDDISFYQSGARGSLQLISGGAASFGQQSPIDLAITNDGSFIYELATGSATVLPFRVETSGALTALTPVSDGEQPHSGQAGIATVDFAEN